jgi:hypothetical protein
MTCEALPPSIIIVLASSIALSFSVTMRTISLGVLLPSAIIRRRISITRAAFVMSASVGNSISIELEPRNVARANHPGVLSFLKQFKPPVETLTTVLLRAAVHRLAYPKGQ